MQNGEAVGKACFNMVLEDDNLEYDIDEFIFSDEENIVIHFQNYSDNIAERIFCEKRNNLKAESDVLNSEYGIYFIIPSKYGNGIVISQNTMNNKFLNARYSLFDMVDTKMEIEGYDLYDVVPYTKKQYENALNFSDAGFNDEDYNE